MSGEEYVLPGEVTLRENDVDKLLQAADGDAALLYLYIQRNRGLMNLEAAAAELRLGERAAKAAQTLRRLGLIRGGKRPAAETVRRETPPPAREERPQPEAPEKLLRPADKLPEYTSKDVQNLIRSNPEFEQMLAEVQQTMGNLLTQSGLQEFAGFYDYLGLPPDVIVTMVGFCVERAGRSLEKDGTPKSPGMAALRREAYRWAERGIRDMKAADEYVKKMELADSRKENYRRILGLTGRAPSPTEERCLNEWAEAGYNVELISEAYDRTVKKTGRMVWKYMDTILKSWEAKGLSSVEAVLQGDRPPAAETGEKDGGSAELERMRQYLSKLKES